MAKDPQLTVCAFWFRKWCGSLGPIYVNRLYAALQKHGASMASGGQFVLFTDRPGEKFHPGIEVRGLPEFTLGLKWNLVKCFMYSSEAGLDGRRVICLDLDVVVLGDLSDILAYRGKFATCEAAYIPGAYGGSVIGFMGGDEELRWRLWVPVLRNRHKTEKATSGSERIWYRQALQPIADQVDLWQRILPGQIRSYKVDCRAAGSPPPGTRLVRFHGHPRPHEVSETWVKRNWANGS